VIGAEVILCDPVFNKTFHVYTDVSDHQLREVTIQERNPVASYSRKINTAQKQYKITERYRELLSTIETFKGI
jgi:hypothetical protein